VTAIPGFWLRSSFGLTKLRSEVKVRVMVSRVSRLVVGLELVFCAKFLNIREFLRNLKTGETIVTF